MDNSAFVIDSTVFVVFGSVGVESADVNPILLHDCMKNSTIK